MFGHNALSKTGVMLHLSALVIIVLGYFVNCCNIMCFFVKTDLLCFLFRTVETTLSRIKSPLLGEMSRNPFSTEARISLTGTLLGAIAKFLTDADAFHFSLTITDAVAIGKPERQVRNASHCGSKQEVIRRKHSIIACSCHVYMGVILHAHILPVRGESHV